MTWTPDNIVLAFRAWGRDHGRVPTTKDWSGQRAADHPSVPTVRRVMGSWRAGVEAAGLRPLGRGRPRRDRLGNEERSTDRCLRCNMTRAEAAFQEVNAPRCGGSYEAEGGRRYFNHKWREPKPRSS